MIDFSVRKLQIIPFGLLYLLLFASLYFSALLYQHQRNEIFVENTSEEVREVVEERLLTVETLIDGLSQYLVLGDTRINHKHTSLFVRRITSQYPFVEAMGILRHPNHLKNVPPSDSHCSFLICAENSTCQIKKEWQQLLGSEALAATVQQAIRSGDIEVSGPLKANGGNQLIAYVKAVYKNNYIPSEIGPRSANLQELVLVFVNSEQLLYLSSPINKTLNVQLQLFNSDSSQSSFEFAREYFYENILDLNRDYFPYELVVSTKKPFGWVSPKIVLGAALLSLLVWMIIIALIVLVRRNREISNKINSLELSIEKNQQILLANTSDAVIQLNKELKIIHVNRSAEKLLDLDASLVLGCDYQTVFNIVRIYPSQILSQIIESLLQSKNAICLFAGYQIQIIKSQKTLGVSGWVIPDIDSNKEIIGLYLFLQPAAAKAGWPLSSESIFKVHSDEFVRVFRIHTIEQMASGIAHEVNQPLSAVLSYNEGCLDLLDETPVDVASIKHALSCSIEQAKRAGHIITALRNTLGKNRSIDRVPVNINQAIENALELLSHDIKRYTIKIEKQLTKELPIVLADTIQLEQVVMNLIRNAIEACRDNKPWGNIAISSAQIDGMIQVRVKDDGCGISEEKINSIFNPFFSTKSDGMGLGLTISQSIIESFGGTIQAVNRTDGKGVEFYFDLPIP